MRLYQPCYVFWWRVPRSQKFLYFHIYVSCLGIVFFHCDLQSWLHYYFNITIFRLQTHTPVRILFLLGFSFCYASRSSHSKMSVVPSSIPLPSMTLLMYISYVEGGRPSIFSGGYHFNIRLGHFSLFINVTYPNHASAHVFVVHLLVMEHETFILHNT